MVGESLGGVGLIGLCTQFASVARWMPDLARKQHEATRLVQLLSRSRHVDVIRIVTEELVKIRGEESW